MAGVLKITTNKNGAIDRGSFLRLRRLQSSAQRVHPLNRSAVRGRGSHLLGRRSTADNRAFTFSATELREGALRNNLSFNQSLRNNVSEEDLRKAKRLLPQHLGGGGDASGVSGVNTENLFPNLNFDDLDAENNLNGPGRALTSIFSGVTYRDNAGDERYKFVQRPQEVIRGGVRRSAVQSGVGYLNLDAITSGDNEGKLPAVEGRNNLVDTSLIHASRVYEEYTQAFRVTDLVKLLDEDNFDRRLFRFKEDTPQIALLQHWLLSLHVTARGGRNDLGKGGSDVSRRMYERIYQAAVNFSVAGANRAYLRGEGVIDGEEKDADLPYIDLSSAPFVPRGAVGEGGATWGRRVVEGDDIFFQISLQFNDGRDYRYQSGVIGRTPTVSLHQGQAFPAEGNSSRGIVYTSGAYREFKSHHDWTAAWLSLYANLVHVYDGTSSFEFQDDANSVRLPAAAGQGVAVGFRNLMYDNGVLGGNSVIHCIVRFIKPEEFRCYKEPETEGEKQINLFLRKKRSVVFLKNTDGMCFFRGLAVLLSRALAEETYRNTTQLTPWHLRAIEGVYPNLALEYPNIAKGRKAQRESAKALAAYCSVDAESVSVGEMPVVAEKLQLCIRILNGRDKFKLLYEFGNTYSCTVYMVAVGDHLHPCWSYKGLLGRSYECVPCDTAYNNASEHTRCPRSCFYCRKKDCSASNVAKEDKVWKKCANCRRAFPTDICFESHMEPYKLRREYTSTCQEVLSCGAFACPTFSKGDYDDLSQHSCLHRRCKNCRKMCLLDTHQCNLLKKNPKKPPSQLYFFDFECTQETGVHVVTHAVVQDATGEESKIFQPTEEGCFDTVCADFCEWVVGYGAHERCTFIAHNGQGYDFHFIMRWALDNKQVPEKVIRVGQKIKHMVICGVRFLDSLSFLMMPLSSFPKTFGLTELAKGYFPHLFNTRENQNYRGCLPDEKYFMPHSMSPGALKKFREWYSQEASKEEEYDFRTEIIKYCVSDVDILRRGCMRFAGLFYNVTEVHPFSYVTIASACLAVYRSKFITEGDIKVLKPSHEEWIRRGFYGGRTNVMQVHVDHSVSPPINEGSAGSIKYVDVTSLYPWVNASKDYPMGAYTFTEYSPALSDFEEVCRVVADTFGFLEVDVVCPQDLLHPVLPSRGETGRLLFDLTPKKNYVVCSEELKEALKHGYGVTAIHKVMHYPEKGVSLCRDYMLLFLKIKQESSGWVGKMVNGRQVETEEEKREWITNYEAAEGVLLDYDNVEYNPGLRAVAKLCMNSLWGKLGQRPVSKTVTFCDNHAEVYHILKNYKVYEVNSTDALNKHGEGIIHELVHSRDKLQVPQPTSYNTNVGFAAFTTAYARLTLYGALNTVGDRAIYCDTDSLIYEHFDNLPGIECGDKLGEWTDECNGDDIIEFVGVGPKTYAYRTKEGKTEVKCKGFKITENNLHVLSFENFKKAMLFGTGKPVTFESVTTRSQIIRDKRSRQLLTDPTAVKKFKPTFTNKGVYDSETGRLLPFNYVK